MDEQSHKSGRIAVGIGIGIEDKPRCLDAAGTGRIKVEHMFNKVSPHHPHPLVKLSNSQAPLAPSSKSNSLGGRRLTHLTIQGQAMNMESGNKSSTKARRQGGQ